MNKFTLIENKAIDKPVEYVILCIGKMPDTWGDMYLSTSTGWWTELALATRFTEDERIKFSLPESGMWVNMTEMMHAMEMSKANHPTAGLRQPRLTIADESE
jgi:hypothetical protein